MSEDLTKKLPQSDSDKLTLILTTVQALSARVDELEQTVNVRLYDTRPLWQKVVTDIAQLQEGQEVLRTEIRAMRRDVYHRFSILNDTLLTIQADHRDVHGRISQLELERNPSNSST